jgi:hypothetical protein
MNQKMHVGGIFCNLANASDFVYHEILLAILNLYGLQGVCVNWFKSHLTNRTNKDVIK